MKMTSSRSYLLNAIYEWIVDNGCTPYLLVNAEAEGVDVPRQFVNDGQIVLNVAMTAVISLDLGKTAVSFNARFGGKPTDVHVPLAAVLGIYARENGQGMVFEPEDPEKILSPEESLAVVQEAPKSEPTVESSEPASNTIKPKAKPAKKPGLRIVK